MAIKKKDKLIGIISCKMTFLILVDLFDVIVTSRSDKESPWCYSP